MQCSFKVNWPSLVIGLMLQSQKKLKKKGASNANVWETISKTASCWRSSNDGPTPEVESHL